MIGIPWDWLEKDLRYEAKKIVEPTKPVAFLHFPSISWKSSSTFEDTVLNSPRISYELFEE